MPAGHAGDEQRGRGFALQLKPAAQGGRVDIHAALFDLECTDAAARHDVPAWARLTGNEFLGERPLAENKTDGGAFALTVRLVR